MSFTVFRSKPTLHSSSRGLSILCHERGRVLFISEQRRRVGISGSVCSVKRFAFRFFEIFVDAFHEDVERVSEHWTRG